MEGFDSQELKKQPCLDFFAQLCSLSLSESSSMTIFLNQDFIEKKNTENFCHEIEKQIKDSNSKNLYNALVNGLKKTQQEFH